MVAIGISDAPFAEEIWKQLTFKTWMNELKSILAPSEEPR